jgi:flavorubredoxin
MKPIEIAPNLYWVGAVDWNIRDFHGYSTKAGTTYNAYLIVDKTVALIDTVKAPFADEMIERISHVIDPKKIDILISNHTEMDHSGSIPRIMHLIGENKPLHCSKMGKKNLSMHFGDRYNFQAVEDGGTLSLGSRSLTFLETRMLHWPDSMFSYCPQDKILFSSDAFGQHYAGPQRFDDEIGEAIMPHAKTYFANILLLYTPLIEKLLARVTEMGLEFSMILPDHGIMWRQNPGKIVEAYARWSRQEPKNKAVVAYDTMWNSTRTMAEAIAEGLGKAGVHALPMHLRVNDRSEVMTQVMDSGLVVVGSPTLNNGLFPTVSDFLTYMKGLKPKNKIGAAFGSYGWSGEATKIVSTQLDEMGFNQPEAPLKVLYVPGAEAKKQCFEWGEKLGKILLDSIQ